MLAIDPHKLPRHIVTDLLAGDLYSHIQYNHLPSTDVPADKLRGVLLGDSEVEANTSTKRGRP